MKRLWSFLTSFLNHGQAKSATNNTSDNTVEFFNTFDKSNHLHPVFDKSRFDTLHSWDFGFAILELINIAKSDDDEKLLSKKLSPGQKALYFIWYLDAQVTNGGFIQFYWNGYAKYLSPITDGLRLIGDNDMLTLIDKADKEFKANIQQFIAQKKKDDWEPLYDNLKKFDEYDDVYYAIHDNMMALIEKYARAYPSEFVNFY
jgi:hypothetical protein